MCTYAEICPGGNGQAGGSINPAISGSVGTSADNWVPIRDNRFEWVNTGPRRCMREGVGSYQADWHSHTSTHQSYAWTLNGAYCCSGGSSTSEAETETEATFTFHATPRTYADARRDCRARGGDIASIHSASENSEAVEVVGGRDAWIGFTDQQVEGQWVWSDGSAVDYTNWDTGRSPITGWATKTVRSSGRVASAASGTTALEGKIATLPWLTCAARRPRSRLPPPSLGLPWAAAAGFSPHHHCRRRVCLQKAQPRTSGGDTDSRRRPAAGSRSAGSGSDVLSPRHRRRPLGPDGRWRQVRCQHGPTDPQIRSQHGPAELVGRVGPASTGGTSAMGWSRRPFLRQKCGLSEIDVCWRES